MYSIVIACSIFSNIFMKEIGTVSEDFNAQNSNEMSVKKGQVVMV
jgi:hypothetical protein